MILYARDNKKIFLKESDIKKIIMNSVDNLLTEVQFYRRKKEEPVYFSMDDEIKLSEDPYAKLDKGKQNGKPRNFAIERNGKQYWVSRSSTISLYVFCKDENGEWNVLVSQRGKNMKFGGKWNVVSGFLDYGETLETAAVRECFEECGINIKGVRMINCGVNSSKVNDAVNHRFAAILNGTINQYPPSMENCEGYGTEMQEVQNVAWIPLSSIDKCNLPPTQQSSAKELAEKLLGDGIEQGSNYRALHEMLHSMAILGEISNEKYNQIINILKK